MQQPHQRPREHRVSTIGIRGAADGDAGAMAHLLGELGYPTEADDVPRRLAAIRSQGNDVFVAVDDSGEILGLVSLVRYATIHATGRTAYIMALVVSSTARGRGVGRLLVDRAKRWAAEQGCVRLSVTSAEHRAGAHAFYPACGMPYTGRRFSTAIEPEGERRAR
jgi:GNAT superfamily N-acetyltransferase